MSLTVVFLTAEDRQTTENAMLERNTLAVTAATLTLELELGIDIGYLERVIQLESPLSVASFLQRLGRRGSRGESADMHFICAEEKPLAETSLPQQIYCKSCQGISTIQLYLEERLIEPIQSIKKTYLSYLYLTYLLFTSLGSSVNLICLSR
jgi:ATP-dependent Lhr-like helicase